MQQQPTQDSFRVELNGFTYNCKRLKPYHFIEFDGIPFDIFDTKIEATGIYAQMHADLEDDTNEVAEKDTATIKKVLDLSVENFDFDTHLELYGIDHISDLFNSVLYYSLEHFKSVIKPNNEMLLNCHYLASKYGGKPINYITDSLDSFLFNMHCLISGSKDEEQQIKKAQRKAQQKRR